VHGWGICGSSPYDVASMFAKICCGATCHLVTAISVVPKLGATQAVWMPGLDVPRCVLGVGRSGRAEIHVTTPF